jgi:HSP20 family protein
MATQNVDQGSKQETASQAQSSQQQQAGSPLAERRHEGRIARRESMLPSLFGSGASLNPFSLMRRMMEDMDRMFEQIGFGSGGLQRSGGLTGGLWSPQIEVLERGGQLLVRADLPGMKGEDIRLDLVGDALILEGERHYEQQEEQGGIWRSERSYGSFRRAIPLPEGIDVENVDARFENGVLEVSLKLPQTQQSRRIEVKGGSAAKEQKAPMH